MSDEVEPEGVGAQAQENSSGRRKWLLIGFTGLILVLGLIYLTYYFTVGRYYLSTDDAYVQGNQVQLMPQVSGTVTVIGAEQTQLVKQGQPLVELDKTDFRIAFERATANLAATVRQVQSLFETAQQQQANVKLQEAQLQLAQKNYYRGKKLIAKNMASRESFDDSLTNLHVAQASLALTRHQLSGSEAIIAGTTVEDHPQVKLAKAQLREAYLALKRTRILAPVTGFVAKRAVQVGQEVNPGTAMMVIVPLRQVWIDANFKETSLADIRIGQPVTLTAGSLWRRRHISWQGSGTFRRYRCRLRALAAAKRYRQLDQDCPTIAGTNRSQSEGTAPTSTLHRALTDRHSRHPPSERSAAGQSLSTQVWLSDVSFRKPNPWRPGHYQ